MVEQSMKVSERPGWFGTPQSRRVARMRFYNGFFFDLFRAGISYRVDQRPFPDDAKIVAVEYEAYPGSWVVYLESETYTEVGEGSLPPFVDAPSIWVEMVEQPA
jgi:hypothetical protein